MHVDIFLKCSMYKYFNLAINNCVNVIPKSLGKNTKNMGDKLLWMINYQNRNEI